MSAATDAPLAKARLRRTRRRSPAWTSAKASRLAATRQALRAAGKQVIFCGDANTAHREIDLARPKENQTVTGFLPEERAWIDKITSLSYIDTFRHFYPELAEQYTWCHQVTFARQGNVGWRIDYFFAAPELAPRLVDAFISPAVMGSDHCPVGLTSAI